jgi:hypothetical protein
MKKLLFLGIFAVLPLFPQSYTVQKTTVLSGAAEVITVQQPNTGSRKVFFQAAYVDCSVACTVTLERSGTAASATTLAVNNINVGEAAAKVTAFSGSNVGTGITLGAYSVNAGGSLVIDLSAVQWNIGVNTTNLTIRTSSISGTVNILIQLREQD